MNSIGKCNKQNAHATIHSLQPNWLNAKVISQSIFAKCSRTDRLYEKVLYIHLVDGNSMQMPFKFIHSTHSFQPQNFSIRRNKRSINLSWIANQTNILLPHFNTRQIWSSLERQRPNVTATLLLLAFISNVTNICIWSKLNYQRFIATLGSIYTCFCLCNPMEFHLRCIPMVFFLHSMGMFFLLNSLFNAWFFFFERKNCALFWTYFYLFESKNDQFNESCGKFLKKREKKTQAIKIGICWEKIS